VYFCPYCCNILLIEHAVEMRFYCKTCPYVFYPKGKLSSTTKLQRKKVEEALGTFDAGAITEIRCDKCNNTKAYFMQMQTRSADEPMTLFYKCTGCGNQWKEG